MRKVEIPCIYDADTGNWLVVGAITYDENNEIVEVDHFDGDGFVTYEKGEFVVDEINIASIYQNNACTFIEKE